MKLAYFATATAALLLAAACEHSAEPPKDEDEAAMPNADCAIIASRDWKAWIDTMPGVGSTPMLHVAGEVDMPTPGYSFEWAAGPLDRRMPPTQHLKLSATAPDGMVAQVVSTETVKYEGAAQASEYSAIVIRCGDEVLAEITEIGRTQ